MDIKQVLAGGSAILFAIGVITGSVLGETAKPYANVVEPAAEEVGLAPTEPAHPFCHPGWEAKVVKTIDTQSYNCIKGEWTVVVDTATGEFLLAERGGSFFPEDAVPGW